MVIKCNNVEAVAPAQLRDGISHEHRYTVTTLSSTNLEKVAEGTLLYYTENKDSLSVRILKTYG